MFEFFAHLFSGSPYMPHRHCYIDDQTVIALHVVSDSLVCLAYYSIPVMLIYFVSRRRDMPFNWIFRMFGMFIFACGTTHLMEVITLWEPMYRLSGVIKAWTAVISVATAIALIPLLPRALALPSLAHTNARLAQANRELERASSDLQRSNRELEHFAAVASHDLQEPLRTVSNYLDLLKRRAGDRLHEDERQYIVNAVDGSVRMQGLIRDLLSYSRAGAECVRTPIAPDPVLDEALGNLGPKLLETAAVVTREPLPTVMTDRTHLLQVFQNLIGNALKFRRAGEPPRVHIAAAREDGMAVFSVRDQGIGIASEHLEQVFELFQRLNPRGEYAGTGIGLAICKKIVEAHGGRMWVRSVPGEGSTFQFTLPLA
jgi:signal transduction histidine kinase